MNGGTQGLSPWAKTKETNKMVLEKSGCGTKGEEVLQPTVHNGDRSNPGVPYIPYSI